MKIYTKQGDQGETSLFGNDRVAKDDIRVEAYGTIDEANSFIGLAAAVPGIPRDVRVNLLEIMSDLLDIGSELAVPRSQIKQPESRIVQSRIEELEHIIDQSEQVLDPLDTFLLPTGSESTARLHVARTAVRRAERKVVHLVRSGEEVRQEIQTYLNRLSDVLFILARVCNKRFGYGDIEWYSSKKR